MDVQGFSPRKLHSNKPNELATETSGFEGVDKEADESDRLPMKTDLLTGLPATLFNENQVQEKIAEHYGGEENALKGADEDDVDDVDIIDSADANAGTESDADSEDDDDDDDDDEDADLDDKKKKKHKKKKKVSGKKRPASKPADVSRALKMPRRQVKPLTPFSPVDEIKAKTNSKKKKNNVVEDDPFSVVTAAAAAAKTPVLVEAAPPPPPPMSTLKHKKTKQETADVNDAAGLSYYGDLRQFEDVLEFEDGTDDRILVADNKFYIKNNKVYMGKGKGIRLSKTLDWIHFMGTMYVTLKKSVTSSAMPVAAADDDDDDDDPVPPDIRASLTRSQWANADPSQAYVTAENQSKFNEVKANILKDITETKTANAYWMNRAAELAVDNAKLACDVDELKRSNKVVNDRYAAEKAKSDAASTTTADVESLRHELADFKVKSENSLAILSEQKTEANNKHVKEATELKQRIKDLVKEKTSDQEAHTSVLFDAQHNIEKLVGELSAAKKQFTEEFGALQTEANAAAVRIADLEKQIDEGEAELLRLEDSNKKLAGDKKALLARNETLVATCKTAVVDYIKNLDLGDVCGAQPPPAEKSAELI